MTTVTLPVPNFPKTRQRFGKFRTWAKMYGIPFAKSKARIYAKETKGNIYTIFGLTCFAAAGFVHSVFAGLLVTGVCWLALELKTRGT